MLILLLLGGVVSQDKWHYSADELEQLTVDGESARKFKRSVRIYRGNTTLFTDNATQHMSRNMLHLKGNTIMIDGTDTLTCDSMFYWTDLDSGYAMGNVSFSQPEKTRRLTTETFNYWKTDGYRGSSFFTKGFTRIIDSDRLITANEIRYDDDQQVMKLYVNVSVKDPHRGIFGNEMEIQYADSLMKKIHVVSRAFAYNDLNAVVEEGGKFHLFRDEMTSKEMTAHFDNDLIFRLDLYNMATTLYHVLEDSLLLGTNAASGDTIAIDFKEGELNRIRVFGGARGQFHPEENNTKIDSTVTYSANFIDYHIDDQLSFLDKTAKVEYQNTELSAGAIEVDWKTNILYADEKDDELPTVNTVGEEPMSGKSMVFDLIAKHGKIDQGRTNFNQSFYHGREVFRDDPNVFHVRESKYTSCDLDDPHFYLGSRKMKLLPGDRVVAKPLWLYIYDFPVIGLPLAVFPNKGGKRHSGWLMPSFDSYNSIGTGFRNFGFYWAPNEFLDEKILINFFDEHGIHLRSFLNYKKRHGTRWYNFHYNGRLTGTLKRSITTEEILDVWNKKKTTEDWTMRWNHSQQFDPTQRLSLKYDYVSNRSAYQNNNEVDLQNRLKQNLSSSLNYSKNWQSSSFSIGYNEFRDLSIENTPPDAVDYLYLDKFKSYKYRDGPKLNFRLNTRKLFGSGDNWYNTLSTSYSFKSNLGRKDFWLVKEEDTTFVDGDTIISTSWADIDTVRLKKGGIRHSSALSAPQNFFNWLTLNPSVSLWEDWIFAYKTVDSNEEEKEIEGFKRRFTWESSLSANTKIYGLLPITIGQLNAIRHVITPGLSFSYRPDFSDPNFGGDIYFLQQPNGELHDYFSGSFVGSTSKTEKKSYRLSVNNVFQAKIRQKEGGYDKINFLTWNMSVNYNTVLTEFKMSDLKSIIRVKNPSGGDLFNIGMSHSFYPLDESGVMIDKLMIPWKGDKPRLTRMDLTTAMKIKLAGAYIGTKLEESALTDTLDQLDDEDYYQSEQKTPETNNNNIWETKIQFNFRGNLKPDYDHCDSGVIDCEPILDEWDYKFTMKTISSINLTKSWNLTYIADFNIKERVMIYHSFKFYRPLHCWEFSFNWWPHGVSSGFSLKISVKNPDMRDIKLTSSDGKRGFGSTYGY